MNRYCFHCAGILGLLNPDIPGNLFSTDQQLEKFIKHTTPPALLPGLHSVFTDPSTVAYKDYIVSTVSSGYVEVDNLERTNICWVGSSHSGTTYRNGLFYLPTNSVKVVLHDNRYKIHAFPISTEGLQGNLCDMCGNPIIQN